MSKIHRFTTQVSWTGNLGQGTTAYNAYSRNHTVLSPNKPEIACSSDPVFLGDGTKYNPEDMIIASASACHMLWYLHLCADAGVVVTEYSDSAEGTLAINANGSGKFSEIVLHPVVTVKEQSMVKKATELHHRANQMCFIANSCNFAIKHLPVIKVG